jgi:hypothetical protein
MLSGNSPGPMSKQQTWLVHFEIRKQLGFDDSRSEFGR